MSQRSSDNTSVSGVSDDLSPFDAALAGVRSPGIGSDFAATLIVLMRSMRDGLQPLELVDDRLDAYLTHRRIVPDDADRAARSARSAQVEAPAGGEFIAIPIAEGPPSPDERFRLAAPVDLQPPMPPGPTAPPGPAGPSMPPRQPDFEITSRFPAVAVPDPALGPRRAPSAFGAEKPPPARSRAAPPAGPAVARPRPIAPVRPGSPRPRRRSVFTSVAFIAPFLSALLAAALVGGFLWWQARTEGASADDGFGSLPAIEAQPDLL